MTNCKNCGAPIDKSGVCSYCGTVYAVKFIDKPISNRRVGFTISLSSYNKDRRNEFCANDTCAFGYATMTALQRKIRANENIRTDTARTTLW